MGKRSLCHRLSQYFPLHFYKMFTWEIYLQNYEYGATSGRRQREKEQWEKERGRYGIKELDDETGQQILIESASTLRSSAETWNFVVLQREFVVVCYFLIDTDWLFTVDNNFLLALNRNDFRVTIGL